MIKNTETLEKALFSTVSTGESLYVILDGARNIQIPLTVRDSELEHDSLYRGRSEEELWGVAPYLVRCEQGSEFFRWLLREGWGNSWGIFLTSTASLEDLRKHFRQFLIVQLEDDKEVYFRFYDPRVLRVYLPTCTPEESKEFFGVVRQYLIEDGTSAVLLKFSVSQNRPVVLLVGSPQNTKDTIT